MRFNLGVIVLVCIVNPLRGFRIYTSLQKVVFTTLGEDEPDDVHSEYYFGKCSSRRKHQLFKVEKTYEDVVGKMIVRGWFKKTDTEPQCVYVRARSEYGDLVRYHSFKFNFCICTIIYSYRNNDYISMFYEWYMPVEMTKGIKWEILFYA